MVVERKTKREMSWLVLLLLLLLMFLLFFFYFTYATLGWRDSSVYIPKLLLVA